MVSGGTDQCLPCIPVLQEESRGTCIWECTQKCSASYFSISSYLIKNIKEFL